MTRQWSRLRGPVGSMHSFAIFTHLRFSLWLIFTETISDSTLRTMTRRYFSINSWCSSRSSCIFLLRIVLACSFASLAYTKRSFWYSVESREQRKFAYFRLASNERAQFNVRKGKEKGYSNCVSNYPVTVARGLIGVVNGIDVPKWSVWPRRWWVVAR